MGYSVLLIDTDKQGSSASWVLARKSDTDEDGNVRLRSEGFNPAMTPDCMRLYDKEIMTEGPSHANKYDFTIIDTRGSDSSGMRASLIISDFAIIPVRDGGFDRRAINDLTEALNDVSIVNSKLQVMSFLNQIDARRKYPKESFETLLESGLSPIEPYLRFRASYSRAAEAETVFEMEDPDGNDIFEMNRVFKEILKGASK